MTVFERIEELRKSRHISQGKLEKELGFSNGSISKWKTSTPTPERLQKLAEYFNTSTEYLLGKVPFKNEDEEKTSISIASVKYVMNNRNDFGPHFAEGPMDYYYYLLHESNYRLYKYIDRLDTMYENKDNRISNLEYFELANILFKDIKYSKNYDGLIYLTDFNDEDGVVKLDLNEIPRFTKASIKFDDSLFYKLLDSKDDDYITHASLLKSTNVNKENALEIDKLKQSFSNEALEVAKAYDTTTVDKKTIVKLTLGISDNNNDNDNFYTLPNAAHEIKEATEEDKAYDDAIMDDEDF